MNSSIDCQYIKKKESTEDTGPPLGLVRPGLWAKREILPEVKRKLRAKVPTLTIHEVRAERMPHLNVLLIELGEKGYEKTRRFIYDLVQMEKNQIESRHISNPFLSTSSSNKILSDIATSLQKAEEKEKVVFQRGESIEEIMKLAMRLAEEPREYYWIAEQIFLLAERIGESFRGVVEARSRYCYARFLVERCSFHIGALPILEKAHKLCAGNWTVSSDSSTLLLQEINYLLYLCLEKTKDDTDNVINTTKQALKCAIASDYKSIIPRAYMGCANAYSDEHDHEKTLEYYSMAVKYAEENNLYDALCKSHLSKGKCLLTQRQIKEAEQCAKAAEKTARKHNLKFELGKAYMLLGRVSVAHGHISQAPQYFRSAIENFLDLKKERLAAGARCSGATAMAQLILPPLVDLINKSAYKGERSRYLKALYLWRTFGTFFWNDEFRSTEFRTKIESGEDLDEEEQEFEYDFECEREFEVEEEHSESEKLIFQQDLYEESQNSITTIQTQSVYGTTKVLSEDDIIM